MGQLWLNPVASLISAAGYIAFLPLALCQHKAVPDFPSPSFSKCLPAHFHCCILEGG